jgi:hypothetical protein
MLSGLYFLLENAGLHVFAETQLSRAGFTFYQNFTGVCCDNRFYPYYEYLLDGIRCFDKMKFI